MGRQFPKKIYPEKTQAPKQSTGSCEVQWTLLRSKVQSLADAIHLVHSTGAIVPVPYLLSKENAGVLRLAQ